MITFLIGHRGVGKTSLLWRLSHYFPEAHCFCLDQEIEKRYGPIKDIFSMQGEAEFRQLERSVFKEIYNEAQKASLAFVALGAGFDGELPEPSQKIWVQRNVDLSRFVFLNRPSLNEDRSIPYIPLEIFAQRSAKYRELATAEYLLPEGEYDFLVEEKLLFQNQLKNIGGTLTVLPQNVERVDFASWCKDRSEWGVEYFELRDDLLTSEQISKVLPLIPEQKRLFSFRMTPILATSASLAEQCTLVDWPLEFGPAPENLNSKVILSHHGNLESFEDDFLRVNLLDGPVKWSPLIESLAQLEKAHQWVLQNSNRSLLPRSSSGKWTWYRLLQKNRQKLNFFREGEGSAVDQPSLVQWAQRDRRFKKFAAVLGSPVTHSWTPQFHSTFFKEKKMNVLAIDATEDELRKGGFVFLQKLGFKAFAVTSPLKSWAASVVGASEPCNTLAFDEKEQAWYGTSTDKQGFLALVQQAEILFTRGKNAVVWGGGGVLPPLKEVLPQAHFYSSRTGRPRSGHPMAESPSTIIWAGGDTIQTITSCHPNWKPERVVDLNYRGDSAGLAYALHLGARYFSGREMFFGQAEGQQKFWSRYEWS